MQWQQDLEIGTETLRWKTRSPGNRRKARQLTSARRQDVDRLSPDFDPPVSALEVRRKLPCRPRKADGVGYETVGGSPGVQSRPAPKWNRP